MSISTNKGESSYIRPPPPNTDWNLLSPQCSDKLANVYVKYSLQASSTKIFRSCKLLGEWKTGFAWTQFLWSKNIKQRVWSRSYYNSDVESTVSGYSSALFSFFPSLGVMMLNDLSCLSWDKFPAAWALFIGRRWCINSENRVIAKLESQFIRL